MDKSCKQQRTQLTPPLHSHGDNSRQFKGIRMRKWGKWVSEVRMPNSRAKIWLGSYDTAEQAARAFDAAVYCLRGPNAKFNFPNSIPHIPSASSLSRHQIQLAAAKYALGEIPSTTNNNNRDLTEKPSSPSTSSFLSEMEASSDSQTMSEEQLDFAMWESLLGDSDGGNQLLDLDEFPLFDAATLELTSPIEEQGSLLFDTLRLWNF